MEETTLTCRTHARSEEMYKAMISKGTVSTTDVKVKWNPIQDVVRCRKKLKGSSALWPPVPLHGFLLPKAAAVEL